MGEVLISDRQRSALRRLLALTDDRSRAERQIVQMFESTAQTLKRTVEESIQAVDARFEADKRSAEKEFRARGKRIEAEFESEYSQTQTEYKESLIKIAEKAEANTVATHKALQEAVWLTETVFEATETQPIEHFEQAQKDVDGKLTEFQNIRDRADSLMKRSRQPLRPASQNPQDRNAPETPEEPRKILEACVNEAQARLDQLQGLFIPRLFRSLWPLLFLTIAVVLGVLALAWRANWQVNSVLREGAAAGGGAGLVLLILLYFVARSQVRRAYRPLTRAMDAGRQAAELALDHAAQARDRHKAELIQQRDKDLKEAHERYEPILVQIKQRRQHHLERINEKYPRVLNEIKAKREHDKRSLTEHRQRRAAELTNNHLAETAELQRRFKQDSADNQQRYGQDWAALETRWKNGMAEVYADFEAISAESARRFPAWSDSSWSHWQPPFDFAPVIRFGQMHVDLSKIPGGLPKDPRLAIEGPTKLDIPALLAFPDLCSMLVVSANDDRDQAVQTLQTVMFRLLSTLPPGKVRFTIIDPVGLGQNFAGFMHLADYDGALVTDKIWTEDRHIDQRLLDLTEHMENVIQKYLRNEYQTIGEYNVDAGEIAEPFRFLVIANFPVNFSETAGRRLVSVINSGARCGVYTLISVDSRQPLPQGIQMSDLERSGAKLVYQQGGFAWNDPDYAPFALALDAPPDEDFLTEKLHLIGRNAKDSSRVEVPFDVIAPDDEQVWSADTNANVSISLGRAGATKLQYLTLGQGTSQHALIAGKTGSGKSTLLHALITNLSLWYPPTEVEFYLVDFKKGVEFKTYATHQLPHARAVAIESDREFGLSVLQRLDAELKHRGNLFRELGVQDLASYRRQAGPDAAPMPRTLLIIDEFQELFTEDDKLAQDSALLLDRLVRQGRAFGMHVLLGSQTLGGAYSLARSTIGQMGVRIALQCSEADSYLILSDDNAAARLLSRPGEAIYNDASGMVEGNNPFQIVWLPDEKREQCLNRIRAKAETLSYRPPEPQIVFEGNVPAEVGRNHLLEQMLGRKTPPRLAAASAWLGDAIAIKDPTAAVFRRQSGNNLIIVGQREESALAMLATSLISLASQHAPANARFYILDGSPDDAPTAGYLARAAGLLPHQVRNVSYRDVGSAVAEISEDLERRQQSHHDGDEPAIYLLIYGLQRYRMLRQEDDFSFGSPDPDAPARPEKQFASIIREGPIHGIHTLAWCDTVNNLNRALDRQGLKEFELRVLFQMGATDSSNLIDSPLAARLGLHRAIFFSEEHGHLEKFRPYALPDEEWLARIGQRLARHASIETIGTRAVQSASSLEPEIS
ncbi:MAG: AAA family ATPase [Phycisphaerales bacterium]|nr:AAA family ATPase [Phycisphaerales bacterium]